MGFPGVAGAVLVAVIVFGGGLTIHYLIVFNARTRQSLHDLVVGSYVVQAGSEAAEKPRMWAGHYVFVALILALAVAVPLVLASLLKDWVPKELTLVYEAMLREPEVAGAQVVAGQQAFWDKSGQRVATGVTASVRLNRRIQDHEAEATKLVRILLDKYPGAGTKDSITILLAEGYDLGISSWFFRRGFNYSLQAWRQRLESAGLEQIPATR